MWHSAEHGFVVAIFLAFAFMACQTRIQVYRETWKELGGNMMEAIVNHLTS